MHIVKGRGRNRSILEFPCSHFVKKSPENQQIAARDMLCGMMGVATPTDGGSAFGTETKAA